MKPQTSALKQNDAVIYRHIQHLKLNYTLGYNEIGNAGLNIQYTFHLKNKERASVCEELSDIFSGIYPIFILDLTSYFGLVKGERTKRPIYEVQIVRNAIKNIPENDYYLYWFTFKLFRLKDVIQFLDVISEHIYDLDYAHIEPFLKKEKMWRKKFQMESDFKPSV